MKKGLRRYLGKEITIYSSPNHLLITGVVKYAKCGFIVINTHLDRLPRHAFICKRKLVLKKLDNGTQKTPFSPYRFFVKRGHNIFTAPSPYFFFVKTGHNIFTAPNYMVGGFEYKKIKTL